MEIKFPCIGDFYKRFFFYEIPIIYGMLCVVMLYLCIHGLYNVFNAGNVGSQAPSREECSDCNKEKDIQRQVSAFHMFMTISPM